MSNLLEKRIKSSRTFILGAGFSASAGIPMIGTLLEQAMNTFKDEANGIFQRVNNYARECFLVPENQDVCYSSVSFSELCTFLEYIELKEFGGGERWTKNGSKEKLNLRYYLAKTIILSTPEEDEIPQIYLDFVEELHETDVVLSFNWDPLLERALNKVGKAYTYNFKGKEAIKLSKLHGSVNWRLGEAHELLKSDIDLSWQSMKFTDGMMEQEMYYSPLLLEKALWNTPYRNPEIEPFLVLPGYGKAFDIRSNAELWYKPEWAFAFTHDVYIIGLSLAHDDFFIRSFFLANLPFIDKFTGINGRRIHIINPALDIKDNYDFIIRKGFAEIHQEKFDSKHIKMMRENRLKL
ncbi:MAG: hypothetical protein MJK12_17110 [Colwellia sp.]|nr:hypothetical protein [Colwellia sp.]